ncbi:MAG: ABC transporter ATP-binding protein [Microbacterium sp.]|uniref:ATP-binding cassette domain-containing protein n=1 Tax=Microbacterium sp. TaxID=51671 RepID=UPI0039E60054
MAETTLLEVRDLSIDYGRGKSRTRAVHGVSLDIHTGETFGLVGESGSGKSTVGRAILGLVSAAEGSIRFDGEDITHCGPRRRRELTEQIQVIYQDPFGSLNPARTVGSTLAEGLIARPGRTSSADVRRRVLSALDHVGLPARAAERYPGEFSGGQRQRIAIARAIVLKPRFIVCDEAVSALDLSVQAQVLNLLDDLRTDLGVSYLFISHDLALVGHISRRIGVLYRGELVESGEADQISSHPTHPYTAMLQTAAPVPDPLVQADRRSHFLDRLSELRAASS